MSEKKIVNYYWCEDNAGIQVKWPNDTEYCRWFQNYAEMSCLADQYLGDWEAIQWESEEENYQIED